MTNRAALKLSVEDTILHYQRSIEKTQEKDRVSEQNSIPTISK